MKKTLKFVIAVVAVVLVLVGIVAGGYNSLVDAQTAVETKQADIQTQLQRRADLIPNFVSTVKGFQNMSRTLLRPLQRREQRSAKQLMPKALQKPAMSLIKQFPYGSMPLRRLIPTSRQIQII